jgi:hypothetical protein
VGRHAKAGRHATPRHATPRGTPRQGSHAKGEPRQGTVSSSHAAKAQASRHAKGQCVSFSPDAVRAGFRAVDTAHRQPAQAAPSTRIESCCTLTVRPESVFRKTAAGTGRSDGSARGSRHRLSAFSLLTANPFMSSHHPDVASMAARLGIQAEQIVFRFALEVGMVRLTGTTDEKHMREDLQVLGMRLGPEEVALFDGIAG